MLRRRARCLSDASALSKRCPSIPSTTSPNIWISRRYESNAKRALPVRAREALGRLVVQAEVQDRVHHPRHRDGRAGADRDEQRVVARPKRLPVRSSSRRTCSSTSASSPSGSVARRHVGAAGVGRDREPAGHRHAELRHLGQPDPLAAEQLAAAARRARRSRRRSGRPWTRIYPAGHRRPSRPPAARPELREPGERAQAEPERREQAVEEHQRRRRASCTRAPSASVEPAASASATSEARASRGGARRRG